VSTKAEALAAYEESWIDAGYSSAEEMAEAFGEGRLILERHIEEIQRAPLTAKTLFVEKQFRHDFGEFVLIGKVDRIDEEENGGLEIVDYKTGRSDVTEEEVRYDLAMSCYQLLLKKKYPDKQIKATILAVRTGNSATAGLSLEELEEFEGSLLLLANEILCKNFEEMVPVGKKICKRCDFLRLCRKHPDFTDPTLENAQADLLL